MELFAIEIINNYQLAEVLLPIIAVLYVVLVWYKSRYIINMQKNLDNSMILVPLFRKKFGVVLLSVVSWGVAVGGVICMMTYGEEMLFIPITVMGVASIVLFGNMSRSSFAVTDAGVIVPYRFIAWHELYDYYYADNKSKIIFSGDKNGRQTLTSTTIELSFNRADEQKLDLILSQNKVKHKTN